MERGLEDMSSILKVEDLVKYYGEGENQVRAVDHTSLQIERGKFTAIVGRSGSGKSTLMHGKRFKIKLEQFRQNLLLSGDYDATGNYKQAVKKTAV